MYQPGVLGYFWDVPPCNSATHQGNRVAAYPNCLSDFLIQILTCFLHLANQVNTTIGQLTIVVTNAIWHQLMIASVFRVFGMRHRLNVTLAIVALIAVAVIYFQSMWYFTNERAVNQVVNQSMFTSSFFSAKNDIEVSFPIVLWLNHPSFVFTVYLPKFANPVHGEICNLDPFLVIAHTTQCCIYGRQSTLVSR